MPLAASLKLGSITGPAIQKGREGDLTVVAMRHAVWSDLDPKTGQPSGDRVHGLLSITKNLDFATPALHAAHKEGKELPDFVLRFFHLPRSGPECHYFTIALTKPKIAAIRLVMPSTSETDVAGVHEYEEVDFAYESIGWGTPAPPSEGLDKGTWSAKTATEELVRFAPDWVEEEAKQAVDKMTEAAKERARQEFDKELQEALAKQKK
jgi:type VI secretion system secreted protein Hcp